MQCSESGHHRKKESASWSSASCASSSPAHHPGCSFPVARPSDYAIETAEGKKHSCRRMNLGGWTELLSLLGEKRCRGASEFVPLAHLLTDFIQRCFWQ